MTTASAAAGLLEGVGKGIGAHLPGPARSASHRIGAPPATGGSPSSLDSVHKGVGLIGSPLESPTGPAGAEQHQQQQRQWKAVFQSQGGLGKDGLAQEGSEDSNAGQASGLPSRLSAEIGALSSRDIEKQPETGSAATPASVSGTKSRSLASPIPVAVQGTPSPRFTRTLATPPAFGTPATLATPAKPSAKAIASEAEPTAGEKEPERGSAKITMNHPSLHPALHEQTAMQAVALSAANVTVPFSLPLLPVDSSAGPVTSSSLFLQATAGSADTKEAAFAALPARISSAPLPGRPQSDLRSQISPATERAEAEEGRTVLEARETGSSFSSHIAHLSETEPQSEEKAASRTASPPVSVEKPTEQAASFSAIASPFAMPHNSGSSLSSASEAVVAPWRAASPSRTVSSEPQKGGGALDHADKAWTESPAALHPELTVADKSAEKGSSLSHIYLGNSPGSPAAVLSAEAHPLLQASTSSADPALSTPAHLSATHLSVPLSAPPPSQPGATLSSAGTATPFQRMDMDSGSALAAASASNSHLAGQGLAASYQDPQLGYVELRAHRGLDGVHASLQASSPESSALLEGHLASLHQWLSDRQTPVESLHLVRSQSGLTSANDLAGGSGGSGSSSQQPPAESPRQPPLAHNSRPGREDRSIAETNPATAIVPAVADASRASPARAFSAGRISVMA